MQTYANRLHTEAAMELADELKCGPTEAAQIGGYLGLATIAKQPAVISAVNRAREIIAKERWQEINYSGATMTESERTAANIVWNAMPGYSCRMDAVTILARL